MKSLWITHAHNANIKQTHLSGSLHIVKSKAEQTPFHPAINYNSPKWTMFVDATVNLLWVTMFLSNLCSNSFWKWLCKECLVSACKEQKNAIFWGYVLLTADAVKNRLCSSSRQCYPATDTNGLWCQTGWNAWTTNADQSCIWEHRREAEKWG